jgi:ABC-type transport system involved in cytochrome c biogenesis permease subunit
MNAAERIESLKAGTLSAFTFSLAYSAIALANSLVLAEVSVLIRMQITTGFDLLLRVAVAWLSGFLFGVTYRYVIRTDENSHLKSGAVLAFGLVRGVAPLEIAGDILSQFWALGVLGIESIICFAIARFTLDWAIHHHWVKAFKST